VSGIIHAATLLAILLVAAPLARFVPLATLAAVLFVVAWNMGEWREIGSVLRLAKTDIAVWLATFTLTVVADLTVAVGVGMALAALLYIYRIAETTTVVPVTAEYLRDGRAHILHDKEIPPNVAILRIHGPFLFGAAEKLAEATRDLRAFPSVVIVRLRNMTALDATGLHALETFAERLHKSGRTLLVCGARQQPAELLAGSEFVEHLGVENILRTFSLPWREHVRSRRPLTASVPKWPPIWAESRCKLPAHLLSKKKKAAACNPRYLPYLALLANGQFKKRGSSGGNLSLVPDLRNADHARKSGTRVLTAGVAFQCHAAGNRDGAAVLGNQLAVFKD
jgi:anti-anti-sigma regulatory factor